MRKLITLLGVLAMVLAVGGSANAGYWEVTYDLAGSTSSTDAGLGVKIDPISGAWRIRYHGPQAGPITSMKFVAGDETTDINQVYTGFFTLNGYVNNRLLPASGGTTLVAAGPGTLSSFIVPDQDSSGFNHCTGAACGLAAFTASVAKPLTPTGPGPFPATRPQLTFTSGTIGNGKFTSTAFTRTASAGAVVLTLIYKGTEVSRYYITGDVPAMSGGAMLGLAAFLMVGGISTLALRNRRQ